MKVSKTIRHNRTKLAQLRRKLSQAQDNGNWAVVGELATKTEMVLRRLGRNY